MATILCPGCQLENSIQARFCARCGIALSARESTDTAFQKVLGEAAQSVGELINSPATHNITRRVGEMVQQAGAEIGHAMKSDKVQRALQQIGRLTEQAARVNKDTATSNKKPQKSANQISIRSMARPCLRCGAPNRLDGHFCAVCGAGFDLVSPSLHYTIAYLSDIGQVRSNNEDCAVTWSFSPHGLPAWALLIADGMGGAASGEIASRHVVDVVQQEINARWNTKDQILMDPERWLCGILRQANSEVFSQAKSNPALHGMGSTATLAWLERDLATVAHVGDSRAYLISPAGPYWQITQDHTMVALLVGIGEMTEDEAAADPQNNLLYRAIGIASEVEIDSYVRRMTDGDYLVLCSDGLTRHVPAEEMATIVRQQPDPSASCQALVALANQRGGEDNISVIVAQAHAASVTSGE